MRTTKETKETKQEVKVELTEAFVLWRNKSKAGVDYLSGFTSDEKVKLVGYFNTKKNNPNEPDVRVYSLDAEGKQDIEVASLWSNVSENDKKYLTGTTNDKEKLVAFYGKENEEKRPYIRAYYKQN